MKRLSLTLLFLTAVLCIFADDVEIDGISYRIDLTAKTAELTDGSTNAKAIVIPSSINHNGSTLPVKSIGEYAFSSCPNLTSVTIPNSVTTIGEFAFNKCSTLTSVTIPNSVTTIEKYAFKGCLNLTSIVIPKSVRKIERKAFGECSKLRSVTFSSSNINIDENAFDDCDNFTELIYAEGCTKIFPVWHPSAITHAVLPETATSIADSAFIGNEITSIIIPKSVTHIGVMAFKDCESLTSVTMSNSVASIGHRAFKNCKSLVSVNVSNGTANENNYGIGIGEYAFTECPNLKSVTIPGSIKTIGMGAFENCSKLSSVTIPNSVTKIKTSAFISCRGLTSIEIPNPNVTIEDLAFADCRNLAKVNLAKTATVNIGSAFAGCPEQVSGMSRAEYDKRMEKSRAWTESLFNTTSSSANTSVQETTKKAAVGTWKYIPYRENPSNISMSITFNANGTFTAKKWYRNNYVVRQAGRIIRRYGGEITCTYNGTWRVIDPSNDPEFEQPYTIRLYLDKKNRTGNCTDTYGLTPKTKDEIMNKLDLECPYIRDNTAYWLKDGVLKWVRNDEVTLKK